MVCARAGEKVPEVLGYVEHASNTTTPLRVFVGAPATMGKSLAIAHDRMTEKSREGHYQRPEL